MLEGIIFNDLNIIPDLGFTNKKNVFSVAVGAFAGMDGNLIPR